MIFRMRLRVLWSVLATLPIILPAGTVSSPGKDELVFVRAYPTSQGIEFDAPIEIKWHSLAPNHYEKLSKSELTELASHKDMFGNTEKEYLVKISPQLTGRHYYFISPEGIHELSVEHMKGTVRFRFGDDNQSVTSRDDFGSLIGVRKDGAMPPNGGFVAVSFNAQEFEQKDVEIDLATLQRNMQKDETLAQESKIQSEGFWTTTKKFSFHRKGDEVSYDFIQFAPDTKCEAGCCQSRFILTTAGPLLDLVSWNLSGCDV
jgi:hypothetical protein